jgi:hypothetical protein
MAINFGCWLLTRHCVKQHLYYNHTSLIPQLALAGRHGHQPPAPGRAPRHCLWRHCLPPDRKDRHPRGLWAVLWDEPSGRHKGGHDAGSRWRVCVCGLQGVCLSGKLVALLVKGSAFHMSEGLWPFKNLCLKVAGPPFLTLLNRQISTGSSDNRNSRGRPAWPTMGSSSPTDQT